MIYLIPGENHRDVALTKTIICDETKPCPSDSYCARPDGECEVEGKCMKRPVVCWDSYEPVCGCDGVTYGNECEAAAEGVNIRYWGQCHPDIPQWLNIKINDFLNQPPKNPPIKITMWDYNAKIVYYIPPYCCDIMSELYDQYGNLICSPDGGFAGQGDGKCSDFFSNRKNGKTVWQDTRPRAK